jgi:hypothetical protein
MFFCKLLETNARVVALALSVVLVPTGLTARWGHAAPIVLTASADAEIREDVPETPRGAGTLPTMAGVNGPNGELSIRVTSGQNRVALVRFDLSGLTTADIGGNVDLRIFSRGDGLGGTANNAGGVKIYAVNPTAPNATSWNEQTVIYRDAGLAVPVTPAGAHPTSQPNPGNPILGAPLPWVQVANPITWDSNPSDPNRAPGILHENPAFSAAAETTNANRFAANQTVYADYLADLADDGIVQGTYAYQGYVNQPSYMTAAVGTQYPDLFDNDVPGATVGADFDPSQTSFIGYINYDGRTVARPAGTVFSMTTGIEGSPLTMGADVQNANRTALVAYLTNLLDNGHTAANFYIVHKNTIDNDPLPRRADNLPFASKEFWPAGGNLGDWGPQLILNVPEPATGALFAFAVAVALRRRR